MLNPIGCHDIVPVLIALTLLQKMTPNHQKLIGSVSDSLVPDQNLDVFP